MTQKEKLVSIVIGLGIIGALWYTYGRGPQPEYGFSSVAFKKTGEVVQAYTPKNAVASELGLGGRSILPEDYGMLWQFEKPTKPTFTMRGMNFPLDFIWIKDGKIVEVTASVPVSAYDFSPKVDVTSVLEVNAGYTSKRGLKAGDAAEIQGSAWTGSVSN